jgi:hypothetical protein
VLADTRRLSVHDQPAQEDSFDATGHGQGLRSSTDCPLTVTSAVQADEIARLSILSRTPAAPDAKSGEVD